MEDLLISKDEIISLINPKHTYSLEILHCYFVHLLHKHVEGGGVKIFLLFLLEEGGV